MTDTKTPVRRTARTQPAKASIAAVRAPGTGVAAKTAAGGAKPAIAKNVVTKAVTARKSAAKAAPKVPAKAPASSKAKSSPAVAATAPDTQGKARVLPKGDSFKLRTLLDQVVKATGAKKKGVKDVVEATLSRIGEALARGDELNLPGFGKVRVVKSDAKDGTAIMTLKLRQGTSKPGQKGLADSGDDD